MRGTRVKSWSISCPEGADSILRFQAGHCQMFPLMVPLDDAVGKEWVEWDPDQSGVEGDGIEGTWYLDVGLRERG